jgi:hypothetical protein
MHAPTHKLKVVDLDFLFSIGVAFAIVISLSITFRFLNSYIVDGTGPAHPFGYRAVELTHFLQGSVTIAEAASTDNASLTKQKYKALVTTAKKTQLTLAGKEKALVTVGFKNSGTRPWSAQNVSFVSAAKRESYLHDPSWTTGTIVRASIPRTVSSGGYVEFSFTIEAPRSDGTYTETFHLVGDEGRVSDSDITLTVTVQKQKVAISPKIEEKNTSGQAVRQAPHGPQVSLAGMKMIQSASSLAMPTLGRQHFEIGFKNTGAADWHASEISLRSSAKKESYFYDPSWVNGNNVLKLSKNVKPGELVYFSFYLNAPIWPGAYKENLALYAGDSKMNGTDVVIPITVARTPVTLVQTSPSQPDFGTSEQSSEVKPQTVVVQPGIVEDKKEVEPRIRVGLQYTTDPVMISANTAYDIYDGAGVRVAQSAAGIISTVTFDFGSKMYSLTTPAGIVTTMSYFRFQGAVPAAPENIISADASSTPVTPTTTTPPRDTVVEIVSWSNRPSWNQSINDNKYRTAATDRVWVINELMLEDYLKGIAETSNNSPQEYQKALLVAARTFAKYHVEHNTKYSGLFTVRATDADQVYRGYNAELRLPNVSRALDDTRGVMVFYNGSLAITPYFSQSDGRTRNWDEVWAGASKPWLISKEVPYDSGLQMLGHGVGMSARGAVGMAVEGKTFEEILTYFYTGVELRRRY